MNVTHTFASRLKELREEKGLSQTKLAVMLNVSRGSISFYENEDRLPDIEFLYNVASFFEVSLDFMLGVTDAREKEPTLQNVGKYIKLSDYALKKLHRYSKNSLYKSALNYLLQDNDIIVLLCNYLISTLYDEIKTLPYEDVPVKLQSANLNIYSFATLIEKLPIVRQNYLEWFKGNNDLYKKSLMTYLLSIMDVEQCNIILGKNMSYASEEEIIEIDRLHAENSLFLDSDQSDLYNEQQEYEEYLRQLEYLVNCHEKLFTTDGKNRNPHSETE